METLAIENSCSNVGLYSCPEHISSFLEDFQDKNSHLFPSTDLTFSAPTELDVNPYRTVSVGSKRKLDLVYESFSSWTEDLLLSTNESEDKAELDAVMDSVSNMPFVQTGESSPDFLGSETEAMSSPFFNESQVTQHTSCSEHVDKKRKIDHEGEVPLYTSDACSSSPPGFSFLKEDIEVKPLELPQSSESVKVVSKQPTMTFQELHKTISEGIDAETCLNLKESFSRLASHARANNSPFPVLAQTPSSLNGQLKLSQDYLNLHLIWGSIPVKPGRPSTCVPAPASFYPVTPAYAPYVVNSYYYPSGSLPVSPASPGSQKSPEPMNMYSGSQMVGYTNSCTKSVYYHPHPHATQKYMSPQTYVQQSMIPQQSLYAHQAVHVL